MYRPTDKWLLLLDYTIDLLHIWLACELRSLHDVDTVTVAGVRLVDSGSVNVLWIAALYI